MLLSCTVWGNKIKITGKVVDTETALPVEFASISVVGHPIGVITNEIGEFELNLDEKFIGHSLVVSNIAYITDTVLINQNIHSLVIALVPARFEIEDIIVRPVNPVEILHNAVRNIPVNYSNSPLTLDAYYRELVKVDTAFVKYTDAACKINYCSYNENNNFEQASQSFFSPEGLNLLSISLALPQAFFVVPHQNDTAYIQEVRRSDNLEEFANLPGFRENFNRFDIGGGPLHITAADLVKNRNAIMDTNTWKYYRFKYEGQIDKPGSTIYLISFTPKKIKEEAMWNGRIYIDHMSWAVVQIDMVADENGKKFLELYSTEYIVELPWWKKQKFDGIKRVARITEQTDQEISVIYSTTDSVWHVKSIEVKNTFLNKGNVIPEHAYKTYLLIQINKVEPKLNLAEASVFRANRYNYLFQYQKPYNKEFWRTYNTPKPNGPIYKALQDLERTTNIETQFENR